MWDLRMTTAAKDWTDVGAFETVAEAAGRFIALEGYPTDGVSLSFHVLAGSLTDTDDQALSVFHHTGKRVHYRIQRARAEADEQSQTRTKEDR
jgi:hypothetical protein